MPGPSVLEDTQASIMKAVKTLKFENIDNWNTEDEGI